jgi:hypothetical protein
LKGLFWQYDRQKDTPATLNELIHDAPNLDLDFDELKKFTLSKAQTAKRKVVYNKERALEEGYDELQESVSAIARPNSSVATVPFTPNVSTSVVSPASAPVVAPIDSVIAELTKQFSQLALLLKANIESSRSTTSSVPTVPPAP